MEIWAFEGSAEGGTLIVTLILIVPVERVVLVKLWRGDHFPFVVKQKTRVDDTTRVFSITESGTIGES